MKRSFGRFWYHNKSHGCYAWDVYSLPFACERCVFIDDYRDMDLYRVFQIGKVKSINQCAGPLIGVLIELHVPRNDVQRILQTS